MSCSNFTAPVDIPTTASKCSLKCEYSHNYQSSTIKVTHNGDYISLKPTQTLISDQAEYRNNSYDVEEIRIYRDSLHTYVGEKADSELVIIHRNNMGNDKLLVCIPIINSNVSDDNALILYNVLSEIGKRANSVGKQTTINLATFNLNKFIPKKPYILYEGTQPFKPCNKESKVNYIVFRKQDAIKLMPSSIELLNNLVKKHDYKIKETPKYGFVYNEKGPSLGTSTNDDIYIECKPTGSEGEVLIQTTSLFSSISMNGLNMNDMNKYILYTIGILIGFVIMYILIKLNNKFFNYINSDNIPNNVKKTVSSTAAAAATAVSSKKA